MTYTCEQPDTKRSEATSGGQQTSNGELARK